MEIKDRIKWIRKEKNLNQTDFGEKIGLKQSAVANYENGLRQPIDAVITSICREFSVSETWLRTGEGEPFVKKPREEQIKEYFRDLEGLNEEFKKRLISALAAIRPEDWTIIQQLVERIVRENEARETTEEPKKESDIHLVQAAHQRTDIEIPDGVDTSDDEFFD